jgi:heat-inducible transcriptional repressor
MRAIKRPPKSQRELAVLMACVEQYIKSGRPVGSHTLKEVASAELSSATIRNYFSALEEGGYLKQHHASGGRVPTEKAYRLYLTNLLEDEEVERASLSLVNKEELEIEGQEVSAFLQKAGEWLSERLGLSLFLSFPRFDQDYLIRIRGVVIDHARILFALVTQFGELFSEVLPLKERLSSQAVLRMESYFDWKLRGSPVGECPIVGKEAVFAEGYFQELMLRYIVKHTSFVDEEIFRCGFTHLLRYPEFQDPALLSNGLGLFENGRKMRHLLREAVTQKGLTFWLGRELDLIQVGLEEGALIAMPYRIAHKPVGAFALLAPLRFDYKEILTVLLPFIERVGEVLTETVYHYRLSYRLPSEVTHALGLEEREFLEHSSRKILIEDKRNTRGR